ncbi:MAG: transposase, partial [Acidobacteriaceae bacterium]
VAPFGNTSGTSIRGKEKVHHMANKELKSLLYMGAMSVIQHCSELKRYYERKIESGKHTMCVINAIKAKILLRVAAVIKNQKPYQDKFQAA